MDDTVKHKSFNVGDKVLMHDDTLVTIVAKKWRKHVGWDYTVEYDDGERDIYGPYITSLWRRAPK